MDTEKIVGKVVNAFGVPNGVFEFDNDDYALCLGVLNGLRHIPNMFVEMDRTDDGVKLGIEYIVTKEAYDEPLRNVIRRFVKARYNFACGTYTGGKGMHVMSIRLDKEYTNYDEFSSDVLFFKLSYERIKVEIDRIVERYYKTHKKDELAEANYKRMFG